MYQYLGACMRAKSLSRVQLLAPHGLWPARLLCPWDSSGRKYWRGLPCSPPGDLLIQGLNPRLLTSLASTGRFFTACASCGAPISIYFLITHWMKTKRFCYCSYSRGQPAGVSDFSWGGLCTCGESWIWLQLGCLSPLYLGLAG